jgi:hypothetical protein
MRAETTPLLGTIKNERILRQTAELVHKRLREEAGVHRTTSARFQPRLHDFRHTFAVVRLVTWYREGKNVQRLPLSARKNSSARSDNSFGSSRTA